MTRRNASSTVPLLGPDLWVFRLSGPNAALEV